MITDIKDAKTLTPLEMNKIHFETGRHSDTADKVPSKSTSTNK